MGCNASKIQTSQSVSDPIVIPEQQQSITRPWSGNPVSAGETPLQDLEPALQITPRSFSPLKIQDAQSQQQQQAKNKETPFTEQNIRYVGNRVRSLNLLFFFDFDKTMFEYYNPETCFWKSNDLDLAQNDCPKNPLMFYKNEFWNKDRAEEQLSNMSFVLTEKKVVYIIGGFHPMCSNLAYDMEHNSFSQRAKMLKNINKPNLCCMDRFIYCVSGDEIDNYSTRFDRYDTVSDTWTEFPTLPQPHGSGTALCIVGNSDIVNNMGERTTLKIIVAGGLTQKVPRKYNNKLSIFDFRTMIWDQISLEDLIEKVPKFIRSPLVQDESGKIHILGAEKTNECYMVDLEKKTIVKKGKLAKSDDPEKTGFVNDATLYEGDAYFVYKRENLRESDGMLRIHKGHLASGAWEVI